jgi:hypothetical protein
MDERISPRHFSHPADDASLHPFRELITQAIYSLCSRWNPGQQRHHLHRYAWHLHRETSASLPDASCFRGSGDLWKNQCFSEVNAQHGYIGTLRLWQKGNPG